MTMRARSVVVCPTRPAAGAAILLPVVLGLLVAAGCAPRPIDDPAATILAADAIPATQLRAIDLIALPPGAAGDSGDAGDAAASGEAAATRRDAATDAELDALEQAIWRPGFVPRVRVAAAERLAAIDHDRAMRVLRRRLPNLEAMRGTEALCDLIARRGWVELTPALVSSWARPLVDVTAETEVERAEARALAELHGPDRIVDVVFEQFSDEQGIGAIGLRGRAWELLHRLGERPRLADLVRETPASTDDVLMLDLRAGLLDLGVLPRNREEILWLQRLREPGRADFWGEAVTAIDGMSASRRLTLEMRDVPTVVAAARHAPELLDAELADIARDLGERLDDARTISRDDAVSGNPRDRWRDWRRDLTWGDLASIALILRAMDVQPLVDHLFDYAERDRDDRTTEYGGVLQLDRRGRFELIEFPPRQRLGDRRFSASQAMFDAGYTALAHLHLHVQEPNSRAYAGPGFGDRRYAAATLANCLVFTSIDRRTMNVDWYRHGNVTIDLGCIERRDPAR